MTQRQMLTAMRRLVHFGVVRLTDCGHDATATAQQSIVDLVRRHDDKHSDVVAHVQRLLRRQQWFAWPAILIGLFAAILALVNQLFELVDRLAG